MQSSFSPSGKRPDDNGVNMQYSPETLDDRKNSAESSAMMMGEEMKNSLVESER